MNTRAFSLPRTILAFAVAIVLVIATATGAFYFLTVKAPSDLARNAKEESFDAAKRAARGFKNAFNFTPQVTVGGTTVVEQAGAIAELATVRQEVIVHYHWSQSWLGSTKVMELQGVYTAKAGFNLRDPFRISLDGGRLAADLPAPGLLSLEMTGYRVLTDENGWWNKITLEDREKAIRAMQSEAKTKAEGSGLLEEAKTKFKQEFSDAMKTQNVESSLEISFCAGPTPPQRQEK